MSEFDKILTFSGVSEFGSKWHQIREGSGTTFSAKFHLVATPFLIRELSPISDLLAKQDLTTSTSKSEDRHHVSGQPPERSRVRQPVSGTAHSIE